MAIKHPHIPVPETIQGLTLTDSGYYKPWFVKADDFRIVDTEKAKLARAKKLCWICGQEFKEEKYALAGSPYSAMVRVFREPPCHVDCAEYAMQVCPFILYPNSKRRTSGLEEEDTLDYINQSLEIKYDPTNPGKYYVVVVDDFWFQESTETIRCEEHNILERQCWVEGKKELEIPDPILQHHELPEEVRNRFSPQEFSQKMRASAAGQVITEVTNKDFESRYWNQPDSYSFARRQSIVPLGLQEACHASSDLVVVLVKNDMGYLLAGLLGLEPDQNYLVGRQGEWLGDYIPAVFKAFPFRLGSDAEGNKKLCVEVSSPLVTGSIPDYSKKPKGLPFFEKNGDFSLELEERFKELKVISEDKELASRVVKEFETLSLIKPWPLKLQQGQDGQTRNINGIFTIDESILNNLEAEMLASLRDTGGLKLAYAMLVSMQNIHKVLKARLNQLRN